MKMVITELWVNGHIVAQCAQPHDEFNLNDILVIIKEAERGQEDKVITIK